VDIRQIQEFSGHAIVETTIYTRVVKDLRNPARSPLDMLQECAGAVRTSVRWRGMTDHDAVEQVITMRRNG
jgi:hypothetical protein